MRPRMIRSSWVRIYSHPHIVQRRGRMNSALRTSAQETSAALARNLTGAIRDRAIHQHAVDAHRNRLRSLERCDVLDVGRVENDEVGEGTLADFAAIFELEVARDRKSVV